MSLAAIWEQASWGAVLLVLAGWAVSLIAAYFLGVKQGREAEANVWYRIYR